MKYKTWGVLIFLISFSYMAKSQKLINEATLKYDISIESKDDYSMKQSFEGSYLNIFLQSGKSRTELVTKLGVESNLFDNGTGKGIILKEYSGQKLMITLDKQDWQEKYTEFENLTFSNTGEQKSINGYNCKKAVAKLSDGDIVSVYYADDMEISNKTYSYAFPKLKGLPIIFELMSSGIKFTYYLASASYEPISQKKFEVLNVSQYRVISYKDAMKQKKEN